MGKREQAMRADIQKMIDAFKASRWKSNPYALTHTLIDARSPHLVTMLEMALEQLTDAGTFFQDAISFAPRKDLPRLAQIAVEVLRRDDESRTAQELIAHFSLQCVDALHPLLNDILDLRPNWETYYAHWPWRASGALQFTELARLANSGSVEAMHGWRMLLAKRHPIALDYCIQNAANMERAIKRSEASSVADEFFNVGFELKGGTTCQLYPNRVSHLVFSDSYWPAESSAHLAKRHPTWRGSDTVEFSKAFRFGGWSEQKCPSCADRGHRLISFDKVPAGLPVAGLATLTFETCLTCINGLICPLFYQHDGDGVAHRAGYDGPAVTPEFTWGALVETDVRFAETRSRWQWQDWGQSNSRQNLNRIGGHPCWIQGAEYLTCPFCRETMHALFQLDSNLAVADDNGPTELFWGNGGICYVQWCDRCKVSGQVIQCT